jgi:hypothetical protein
MNTHFVANAYNGGENARLKSFWDTAWKKLRSEVSSLNNRGYDIVITGDFNRNSELPQLHDGTRSIMRNGPDRILAVPADKRKITDVNTGVIKTPSGESFHANLWATITFANK